VIDFRSKIRIRFCVLSEFLFRKSFFNRGSISKRKTGSDFDPEIADRFRNENRWLIFPECFLIAIVIAIAI